MVENGGNTAVGHQRLTDFILELERMKVVLWMDGEALRYRAPRGVMTDKILQDIKGRKEEVIRYLQAQDDTNLLYEPIAPVEEKEYYPLSPAQKRMYIMNQVDKESTSYNIVNVLKIDGVFDKDMLVKVFEKLADRHESLRTSFGIVDGEPVQCIHKKIDLHMDYQEIKGADNEIDSRIKDFIRPYDLSKAPLFRLALIKLIRPDGTRSFFVFLDMHHIICDGSSAAILVKEFNSLFAVKNLPELKIQYKDYVIWYEKLLSSSMVRKQKEYWTEQMKGEIPVLNFLTDYPRPAVFNFQGSYVKYQIDGKLANKLYKLAQDNRVTLFAVLLTAYYVLLFKYTGQSDIIIGTPNAGRRHEDIQNTIGMFVNTLALRNYPEAKKTFQEFLKEVGANSLKAFDNQDYPFENLVESIETQRDSSRNPIFDFMFVLQNMHIDDIRAQGFKSSIYEFDRGFTQYEIKISATENKEGILLEIHYCTSLYKKETIERLGGHFINVLKATTIDSHITLGNIDMLDEEEKMQLLYGFNDTAADYPKEKTIHELFEEQVIKVPDNTAVQFKDDNLTYRELDIEANRLANYLVQEHGVGAESLVGVLMEKSEKIIVAALGILKAGGAYVPIDPEYPFERIKTIIDDAGLGVVISGKKHIKTLNKLQWECKSLNAYLCMDTHSVYTEEEEEKSELMNRDVWEYVGINADDDIGAGAWVNSYTGENLTKEEMREYSGNIFLKVKPYLNKNARVLEIGCASGLSMYNIAPHVGLYYGTDLSGVIINKNKERIDAEGLNNIKLSCVPAHEIDLIDEGNFDIVIMNSVVQCFHGHNYLRGVISKAVGLMKDRGILFIGDIMNQGQKEELISSLVEFKQNNPDCGYRTKTDWSVELFLSKAFFEDLKIDMWEVSGVQFSDKIHTIENELTRFRYDAILEIDKTNKSNSTQLKKHKVQHGIDAIGKYNGTRILPYRSLPGNVAYVIYTSGTTGKPKGVVIEHRNVVRLMFNSRNLFDFCDKDVWTMFHSFSFDFSVWEMYGALLYGGKVIVIPGNAARDTREYLEILKKEKVSVLNQTPGAFYNLMNAEKECEEKGLDLRYVIFGGEALKPAMLGDFKQRYPGVKLINMYGITETTVHVTYKEITGSEIESNISNIGRPIPTLTTYVMDEEMKLVPVGVPGELCVGGDGVGRGYLNRPELTRERFVNNPYKTGERLYKSGDLVRLLPDGDMEYLGRIDHQVKIRGHRIELGEIEAAILKIDTVNAAAAVSKEDESGDRYICVYYVSEDDLTVSEFKEYLSGQLPQYALPSYFVRMEKLPLTPNGKINKKLLPDPLENINVGAEYEAPSNDIEEALAKEWKDLLGLERIGINDNFFELGGHSLKATIFASRVHKLFNTEIPLSEVFRTPTIKGLASYIKNSGASIYAHISPAAEAEYYPLSSAQKRLYLIKMMEGDSVTYNMSGAIYIEGELNVKRVKEVYMALIKRHESLRTSFESIDGEPVQKVNENVKFMINCIEASEENIMEVIKDFIKPFDLSKAPLIRVLLIKLSSDRYVLVSDMHHIISDGMSLEYLTKDFISIYNGQSLPALRIQYKDFSAWQNGIFKTDIIEKQKEFWHEVFSGEIPVLNMPVDFTRPPYQRFEGEIVSFEADYGLVHGLNDLMLKSGSTMYMILLAAYNVLLSKYSGQEDIVVGSPIAGRRHTDLEGIIGMFVNTLAMRNYPESSKTFIQFLKEVRESSVKAYENQDYQFEELVENLDIERDFSRNPLFDTMFVLQNGMPGKMSIEGLSFKPFQFDNKVSKFDLTLNAVEEDNRIIFMFEYCTKLFRRETIKKLADNYLNILKAIVRTPDIIISDIDMLSDEEKRILLKEFNNQGCSYKREKTVYELFEEQVEKFPENTVLIFENEKLTYRELNEKTNRLARFLIKRGVKENRIVGIMMERSIDMIVGILAVLKAGGAYLPVDPEYPIDRINNILEDSRTGILLIQEWLKERIEFSGEMVYFPQDNELADEESANPGKVNNAESLAYVIYTSGTTGKPKGVMVEHGSLSETIQWRRDEYKLGSEDTVLQLFSFAFDGFVTSFFTPVVSGSRIVIMSGSEAKDPVAIKRRIAEHNVTHFISIPSLYSLILEYISEDEAKNLRVVTLAGEKLKDSIVRESKVKNSSLEIVNEYGPTENTVVSTIARDVQPGAVTIGRPAADTAIYILDKNCKILPLGAAGEICISGGRLARGYINRPGLMTQKFIPNPFYPGERIYRTGDKGRWLPDGTIEFLGRIDHQVKIRGFRVEPGEIENLLIKHESVKEALVTDKEDAGGNKYLCAYITSQEEPTVLELREFLAEKLPGYMIPAKFVMIEELPLTPNGKVDRKALPEQDGSMDMGIEYEAPVNELEKKLAEVWEDILGMKNIGINYNFFDIGGDSMRLVKLYARVEKMYPGIITVADLFSYPTISKLAAYLEDKIKARSAGAEIKSSLNFENEFNSILEGVKKGTVSMDDAIELLYKEG